MRYATVCSGIESPSVAWCGLGWEPVFFSEVEAFPRAVLTERYPQVPIHGDFTTIQAEDYGPIDLLCAGTPCQDFSVAGLRAGLDGARGGLTMEFVSLAVRLRPRYLVWENVPGLLSIDGGRAFGLFLRTLGERGGYGLAYRVFDAQHFGVPQRRRRVFVVGYLGDWRPAAAVLFEPESLRRDHPPSREAGQRIAAGLTRGADSSGKGGYAGRRREDDENPIAPPITTNPTADTVRKGEIAVAIRTAQTSSRARGIGEDGQSYTLDGANGQAVVHSLRAHGFDASEDGTRRGTPLTPLTPNGGRAGIGVGAVAAYGISSDAIDRSGEGDGSAGERAGLGIVADAAPSIRARPNNGVAAGMSVRRLTPRECERLQGFPDGYTAIVYRGKPAADGPRYRALGNSMAVPVVRWIGERIAMVQGLLDEGVR